MEQQIKIYELRRHRSGSVFYVYEVFDGPNRLAFGEYSRDYSACMVTTGNGFGIAELTGDPKVLKDPGPGAAVGFAFRLDVKTADVPEWIRAAFIAWKADRENDDEDAGGDRIRFDREDGLYYAIVSGREFGGWQTREQARGGLLVEQRRAADRATSETASSADEAAVLGMTTRAVLAGYVEQEAAGGPMTRETVHKARRAAVMAIDAAARVMLDAAAADNDEVPRFGNCIGKGGKCPAYTTNKSELCNDCLAELSKALEADDPTFRRDADIPNPNSGR